MGVRLRAKRAKLRIIVSGPLDSCYSAIIYINMHDKAIISIILYRATS